MRILHSTAFVIVLLLAGLLPSLMQAQDYYWSNFAGKPGGSGNADGTGGAARFSGPNSVAIGSGGNIYVADQYNHTIRKVSPTGVVTILAGSPGNSGSTDGAGSAARFWNPSGVAVDVDGNVYVADQYNHTIRKVTPGGVVTSLAGSAGNSGSVDGTGSVAQFSYPHGVAVGGDGNIYVADTWNNTIRKVSPSGVVTTLAGSAGNSGSADGVGGAARFFLPNGLAVDASGNIYVADGDNRTIRKVTSLGVVSTLAGSAGNIGSANGTGSAARFVLPRGVAVDGTGNLYVADGADHTIRKITPAGVVTTLVGSAGYFGSADGAGSAARFFYPSGVAVDASDNLYVADTENHTIRKVTPARVVTTLAGSAGNIGGANGTGSAARFWYPNGVGVDGGGNVYVVDGGGRAIRKVTPAGAVTTLAGGLGYGSADGKGSAAQFGYDPSGVAVDGGGNVYVADTGNHTIRKVSSTGVVTTLAGSAGNAGSADGTGSAARFFHPNGLAVDTGGNVYVADEYNHTIRKVTSTGVVTTLAGSAGNDGSTDGAGSAARFWNPSGVAVDGDSNVYVADKNNHTIRQVTSAGVVTTLAGSTGKKGGANGTGSTARFLYPSGVAVDGSGNVYVADKWNHTIRKVTPAGVVTTIGGLAGVIGGENGMGSVAQFNVPIGVAVGSNGFLYVADNSNHRISRGVIGGGFSLDLPEVATNAASSITQTSATSGGNVSGDGGDSVTERGVVYAMASKPNIETGTKVVSGGGAGSFLSELAGLSAGTTYYVRAYAINNAGIAYGNQVSFITSMAPPRKFTLTRSVPAALENTPDKVGILALKAVPARNASRLTQGLAMQTSNVRAGTSMTVAATAKTGYLFSHWSGLPAEVRIMGNVVTFTMPEGDVMGVTAHFIANPFSAPELSSGAPNPLAALGANPVFQGLLQPDSDTIASNSTAGLVIATLLASKGSVSGRVWLDGKVTSFTGMMQGNGSVWFKAGKELSVNLPLVDGVVSNKMLNASWTTNGIDLKVLAPGDAVSTGLAKPKQAATPTALLNVANRKAGYLTLALPAKAQHPPMAAETYPQGTGWAGITMTRTGILKLAGVLADGAKITAGSVLVSGDVSPIFIPQTTPGAKISVKDGSFSGNLAFDTTATDSDVSGANWQWFRPLSVTKETKVQTYREGWPQGITIDPVGALYNATVPVQTALGLAAVDSLNGNALLEFEGANLTSTVSVAVFNIDGNKVVKIPSSNKSFTFGVTAKTGLLKGTFTPNWTNLTTKLPVFQGVVLQKGGNAGGYGFFLSNAAGDINPASGRVTLNAP